MREGSGGGGVSIVKANVCLHSSLFQRKGRKLDLKIKYNHGPKTTQYSRILLGLSEKRLYFSETIPHNSPPKAWSNSNNEANPPQRAVFPMPLPPPTGRAGS